MFFRALAFLLVAVITTASGCNRPAPSAEKPSADRRLTIVAAF